MDNILYGLRDRDFPLFKHSDTVIPSPTTDDGDTDLNFLIKAREVAEEAPLVDDLNVCARSRDDGGACTGATKEGWIFQLDEPYDKSTDVEPKIKGQINTEKPVLHLQFLEEQFIIQYMNHHRVKKM